jgi:hypothetical protein
MEPEVSGPRDTNVGGLIIVVIAIIGIAVLLSYFLPE